MSPASRLFLRSLHEKLAFIPMGASAGPQATGPGGAPVDPTAAAAAAGGPPGAGAPPPGGAPLDPAAAAMPPPGAPLDPSMAGAPPMDPSMAGAPPMDPAAAGAPPMDPAILEAMGAPPAPPSTSAGGEEASVTKSDAQVVMDIVKQTLEMVGKTKTPKAPGETAAPLPASQPGPISGLPGFDPATLGGPLKTAKVLSRFIAK